MSWKDKLVYRILLVIASSLASEELKKLIAPIATEIHLHREAA